MRKNVTEKILAKASGRTAVCPGEYVRVTSQRPVPICADLGTTTIDGLKELGVAKVFDPKRIIMIMDHCGTSAARRAAENAYANRKFARQVGIPSSNVVDLGRQGIGHLVSAERCLALPGTLYLSGTNGHSTTLGGLGAFAVCLSYEQGAYALTGETWLRIPKSIRFDLSGKLQDGVMARDISEYVLGLIGPAGAPYQVLEFTGPAIKMISIDGRLSLCSNALFTGAKTAIVPPDQNTIDYVKARTDEPFEAITSDADAEYAKTYEINLSKIEPQVVIPPQRWSVKPIMEVKGTSIDIGYIGSCANSRLEDMRVAAKILKKRKIPSDVRLNITPGSVNVFLQAMREGLIEIFMEAGAVVPAPACGMCVGVQTPLAGTEVCISTGTCNYPGRMGSEKAHIYLANPATVAASAIEGRISDPRSYL